MQSSNEFFSPPWTITTSNLSSASAISGPCFQLFSRVRQLLAPMLTCQANQLQKSREQQTSSRPLDCTTSYHLLLAEPSTISVDQPTYITKLSPTILSPSTIHYCSCPILAGPRKSAPAFWRHHAAPKASAINGHKKQVHGVGKTRGIRKSEQGWQKFKKRTKQKFFFFFV